MSKSLRWVAFASVVALILSFNACGGGSTVQNNAGATVQLGPRQFTAVGAAGAGFPDAKDKAFAAIMEVAIRELIGESAFNANRGVIAPNFLSYVKGYKYVSDSSYVNRATDASGNMVLTIRGTVDMVALKAALQNAGVSVGGGNTVSTSGNTTMNNTQTVVTSSSTSGNTSFATSTTIASSTSTTPDADLTGVDLTSLSFLVFYNPQNPNIRDAEDRNYANTAVSYMNNRLTTVGVETFDPSAMSQLVDERNLLQQATTGSVGIGMLVAEQVQAELYAEVTPTLNYTGNRAQVALNVKVYVRTTGTLILNVDRGGQEYALVNKDASIKASMREAVDKIMVELSAALKKYVVGGRSYFIRLQGISNYRDASAFSTTIKSVPGVLNVTLKNYSNQDMTGDYIVKFAGNPLDLLDKIMMYLSDKPGFEYLDVQNVRGNEIFFSMN